VDLLFTYDDEDDDDDDAYKEIKKYISHVSNFCDVNERNPD